MIEQGARGWVALARQALHWSVLSATVALGAFGQEAAPSDPVERDGDTPVAAPAQVWRKAALGLVAGNTFEGELAPGPNGSLWIRAPQYEEPFAVDLRTLDWIEFPAREPLTDRQRFLFELTDGARVEGRVLAIENDVWHIDSSALGEVRIPARAIRRTDQGGRDSVLFHAIDGLVGWTESGRRNGWTMGARGLAATGARATLVREFSGLQSRPIQLTLGWRGEPLFRVGLGFAREIEESVTLEVWGQQLVAWRVQERHLEVLRLPYDLGELEEIELFLRIDADAVQFFDREGESLGQVSRGRVGRGDKLGFVCDGLGLEVRRLSIGAQEAALGSEVLRISDVTGFDAASSSFITNAGTVPSSRVAQLTRDNLSASGSTGPAPFVFAAQDGTLALRLTHGTQTVVTGRWLGLEADGRWVLEVPWSEEPIACTSQGLERIAVQQHPADRRRFRSVPESHLASAGRKLSGTLEGLDASGGLQFLPAVAKTTVTVALDGVDSMVLAEKSLFFAPTSRFPHLVHLRSGESLRAQVTAIDPIEVVAETPFGGEQRWPVQWIKAVEVDLAQATELRGRFSAAPPSEPGALDGRIVVHRRGGPQSASRRRFELPFRKESLELALALPRKDKSRPPSHLLVARNGDFLRVELAGWSAELGVAIATRAVDDEGEAVLRHVPLRGVAALVWLDADDVPLEGAVRGTVVPRLADTRGPVGRLMVDDENRLDVELLAVEQGALRLRSVVVGEFTLEQGHALRLDFGDSQDPSFYADWILRPMPEPRAAR